MCLSINRLSYVVIYWPFLNKVPQKQQSERPPAITTTATYQNMQDSQNDRQANRQANREADRQTDRQTDRQAGRQTDRQTDKQTHGQTDKQKNI